MPIPVPNDGEDSKDFLSRCIGFLVGEGKPNDQAAAICYSQLEKSVAQDKKLRNSSSGEMQFTSLQNLEEVPPLPEGFEKPKTPLQQLEDSLRQP